MSKKLFKDMTQEEIYNMTKEEFEAVLPEDKRSCYDCYHLTSACSLWCSNKEAIEYRKTTIPGCIKCIFWKPIPEPTTITSFFKGEAK